MHWVMYSLEKEKEKKEKKIQPKAVIHNLQDQDGRRVYLMSTVSIWIDLCTQ